MSSSKCILKLGTQTATINPNCGSVESWSVLDLGDILYPAKHDHPEFKGWPNGGCPILFPTPGRVYDKDDHQGILDNWPNENPLNIHGLAWELPWSVIQTSQNNCSMALISSAASRKLYPFEFEITQNIELHQTPRAGLSIEVTIKNPSNSEVLPYCFGFHPFFRTLSSGDLISLEAGQYFAIVYWSATGTGLGRCIPTVACSRTWNHTFKPEGVCSSPVMTVLPAPRTVF